MLLITYRKGVKTLLQEPNCVGKSAYQIEPSESLYHKPDGKTAYLTHRTETAIISSPSAVSSGNGHPPEVPLFHRIFLVFPPSEAPRSAIFRRSAVIFCPIRKKDGQKGKNRYNTPESALGARKRPL